MRFLLHDLKSARSLRLVVVPQFTKTTFNLAGRVAMATMFAAACCAAARADNAVSVNSQGTADAFVGVAQSIGWRFTVNSPIQITSLGLLDKNNDGFQADHPVAMWDSQGAMLANVTIHAGAIE